ncbi:flotillin domain-containing protein [Seohaeicola sp. SP36]|uniref:flotillin family protein n=1 Tax=unclassified Seohaeicola TaxID=2641111 RepID=UPI00237A7EB1|nr:MULTISPECIES: flotillin domain-containing protein [unclassified Seohaeicola]MDD9709013.1 flotillin domain-containing protein [Seohaeicola sp. 4SK31]MDD9737099.1 flotillin domain-containing protein [Seohaeicola sp. SP36]
MSALGWIIVLIVIAAALIALAAWFYERATNEVALVKTGIGGRRVIIDGGTLALPYFHEITRVNMQTIRMTVSRTGEAALITKDRLRVDVGADFYVSVTPQAETITRAAQTLGKRLFQPDQLRGLIDGMMIDALRSVAARMTMDELHENRAQFVREVREGLAEAMANYGLQLDSVSLTGLDQTPFSALDENNAFNAVGMRKLAEVIAKSKKERAEIESESDVSVRRAAMEAAKRKLEIDLEQRRAEIAQGQEIETLMAAQLAEVAQRKADSERTAAQARIRMEQDIQAADIAREQAIREAEIAQSRALEDAESDRQIQLSAKSQEESRAKAQADAARAEAVTAAEAVQTARAMAEAERRRALALIAAQEQAEAAAKRAEIAAASDKATAADKADARRAEAEATKAVELARVEAERARIEAENARSDAIIAMELEKARLEAMPRILAEMVRPAEKITGISVNHLSGVGGTRAEGSDRPASPVNATVDAIMDMAVQLPSLQKLGDQISANLAQVSGKKKSSD